MISIHNDMRSHGFATEDAPHTRIPGIWKKLNQLYELDALDERENQYAFSEDPDPSDRDDAANMPHFELPEDEFGSRTAPAAHALRKPRHQRKQRPRQRTQRLPERAERTQRLRRAPRAPPTPRGPARHSLQSLPRTRKRTTRKDRVRNQKRTAPPLPGGQIVVEHGQLQPSAHGRGEKAQHRYTTAFIVWDTQNSDTQHVLFTAH
jgi:hypothetical protein